ncbi:coiled-coil alpha-helical rod protein 1-like isoform X11 [Falco rusticolus]|nr:coiled-coil alpha-helical rod protein 1-like isoform X11 [Falco rusticolus]
MAESHREPPGTGLRGLVPPSHFVLRPPGPSIRSLEVELAAERGRGQALEAELDAERRRSQTLEAELEGERRRSQTLEAELEAERRRSQTLEAELEADRGRGQTLEAELEVERGRGQALEAELEVERRHGHDLEAELDAERGHGQTLEVELEAERRRVQALEAELAAERGRGQPRGAEPDGQSLEEAQVLLQARLSALGHILTLQEHELGRELPPAGVPLAVAPSRLQGLLGRWREKVFSLLVQLRVQEEVQRVLRAQVGTLGTAVAAGTRRVTRLELSLRERAATAELQRRDVERLAQEVVQQRGRAEAAEEALRGLAQAAARLARVVTAREAEVTAATGTMVTLSARLRRVGQRLHVLQGLMSPAVALDQARWRQDPAGDCLVAKVTGSTHLLAGTVAKVRRSGERGHAGDTLGTPLVGRASLVGHKGTPAVALGVAEKVTHSGVTKDKATPCKDRMGHPPGRVSPHVSPAALGSLVMQLQALGAAILGDDGDNDDIADPPPNPGTPEPLSTGMSGWKAVVEPSSNGEDPPGKRGQHSPELCWQPVSCHHRRSCGEHLQMFRNIPVMDNPGLSVGKSGISSPRS